MQEEVEQKTVNLAVTTTKLTGRVAVKAIAWYLRHRKEKKLEKANEIPHGKQSVKELIGQNAGVSTIDVSKTGLRDFERIAKKYNVDFAVTKDKTVDPLKYVIFFKARDADALIYEESQAWAHGPVYPQIYNKYKKFGYKPIDDGIYSTHGCMLSKLTDKEINAIDLVINTFGLYSPKTLEKISHSQEPWKEKRIGYKEDEVGREVIDENSIRSFYIENMLNSEETILKYIMNCIKNIQCS